MARVQVDRAAILRAARQAGREELEIGMRVAQARAKILCPVDTGRLRSSIRYTIRNRALGVTANLISDVSYAQYVNDGTPPHVIRPKRAGGVLRFRIGGQVVFARFVNHPGTRARPFLTEAVRQVAAARGWRIRGGIRLQ